MPVLATTTALPRQELAMAIVEGEKAVKNLIGEKILPPFPVNRRTAHIIKATLAGSGWGRTIDANKYIHAPGTKFERMVASFGDDTITVALRGVEIVIPNETEMDFREYLAVETLFAHRFGNEVSGLTKEKLIAAAIFNTTTFGAATNSAAAYTAANGTIAASEAGTGNSFIADVIAATRRIKAKGELADTIVMSGPVYERIRQAASVQAYIKGVLVGTTEVTLDTIQRALAEFGIKQVLVGESYYNNAAQYATASLSQIWSNTYVWVGASGNPGQAAETAGIGVPTLGGVGANVYWEGFNAGGAPSLDKSSMSFGGGNYVQSYPDLTVDSMVLRLKLSNLPYIGNARGGDLIATQYS